MGEKTLKFNNIKVNKKEFHKSKQTIDMPHLIKNSEPWENYEDIWNVIKNKLNIKFHSQPIYANKYLKTKEREFDGSIKTNFLGNGLPKENMYYTCIACITLDSV